MLTPAKGTKVTPCSVMFDVLKHQAHVSHAELAGIVLSASPMADGRSAVAHASDRSWLSRFVVHAPADAVQDRLFSDFGSAAGRLCMRLRSRRHHPMSAEEIFSMVRSGEAEAMDAALESFGSDPRPYRNALDRMALTPGRTQDEAAQLALVLFVAAGCSGSAAAAVDYLLEWERGSFGVGCPTPASAALDGCGDAASAGVTPCLGLVRVCEGYVMGQPHWVDPAGAGCVVGSLATDDSGLCNVEADVSSRHLRVWFADGAWWASDLGSTNGSWLRPASGPSEVRLEPGERHALAPGDELRLGAFTRFVLLEGLPG